jgi:hypothetical protein
MSSRIQHKAARGSTNYGVSTQVQLRGKIYAHISGVKKALAPINFDKGTVGSARLVGRINQNRFT